MPSIGVLCSINILIYFYLVLSLPALSIINQVVGKNIKIEIRVKKSEINVSIKIIGNEKERPKIEPKMNAFLERFSKRTSSKKPKNLAELIQEVIEADKEVKLNLLTLWDASTFIGQSNSRRRKK